MAKGVVEGLPQKEPDLPKFLGRNAVLLDDRVKMVLNLEVRDLVSPHGREFAAAKVLVPALLFPQGCRCGQVLMILAVSGPELVHLLEGSRSDIMVIELPVKLFFCRRPEIPSYE